MTCHSGLSYQLNKNTFLCSAAKFTVSGADFLIYGSDYISCIVSTNKLSFGVILLYFM